MPDVGERHRALRGGSPPPPRQTSDVISPEESPVIKPIAVLLTVAILALAAPAPCEAGDVQGTVTIKSGVAPRATGKKSDGGGASDSESYGGYSGEDDAPPPRLSKAAEAQYVIVYLVGNLKATPETVVVRQKDKEFVPHVVPVVRGSNVLFTNDDKIIHNIYSVDAARKFEIGKYSQGNSKKIQMDRSGRVELFCSIHSRMNGYVFVVDNDFHAMPGKSGQFTIKGVPPGTYTLKAWHPRVRAECSQKITVPASGTVQVDVTL